MKKILFILILCFISIQSHAQYETGMIENAGSIGNITAVDTMDVSYSDTVYSEEAPLALNVSEVNRMIIYPEEAREEGIEGRVVIKLLIDQEGNVEKTGEITGPVIFYKEVKRIVMMLKFSPGKVNGYPVKVWVTLPYNFKLE